MDNEIELTREEVGALIAIDGATIQGEDTSKYVDASKRLVQSGYVLVTSKGLASAPKGKKWIVDNPKKIEAYHRGEKWANEQMSTGNWIKE